MSLPPSNFSVIQTDFSDFIESIQDGDKRGSASTALAQRKTIRFKGHTSILYCYEVLSKITTPEGERIIIEKSYYDWEDENGVSLLKIHSEPHRNGDYKTRTEPHHTHPSDPTSGTDRLPNFYHRELGTVIELIRFQLRLAMDRVINGLKVQDEASATDESKKSST